MAQTLVPRELRTLTPLDVDNHPAQVNLRNALKKYYWANERSKCDPFAKNERKLEACIQEYWRQRIATDFRGFPHKEPDYKDEFYNWLAIGVQRNVEDILILRAERRNPEMQLQLESDCFSASLVLGSVIFETCQSCHSITFPLDPHNRTDREQLELVQAIRKESAAPIRLISASTRFRESFITGPPYLGTGSLQAYSILEPALDKPADWPDYVIFVDRNLFTVVGPLDYNKPADHHAPKLFVDYLKRRGLISTVAEDMYRILKFLPVWTSDNWI